MGNSTVPESKSMRFVVPSIKPRSPTSRVSSIPNNALVIKSELSFHEGFIHPEYNLKKDNPIRKGFLKNGRALSKAHRLCTLFSVFKDA